VANAIFPPYSLHLLLHPNLVNDHANELKAQPKNRRLRGFHFLPPASLEVTENTEKKKQERDEAQTCFDYNFSFVNEMKRRLGQ